MRGLNQGPSLPDGTDTPLTASFQLQPPVKWPHIKQQAWENSPSGKLETHKLHLFSEDVFHQAWVCTAHLCLTLRWQRQNDQYKSKFSLSYTENPGQPGLPGEN